MRLVKSRFHRFRTLRNRPPRDRTPFRARTPPSPSPTHFEPENDYAIEEFRFRLTAGFACEEFEDEFIPMPKSMRLRWRVRCDCGSFDHEGLRARLSSKTKAPSTTNRRRRCVRDRHRHRGFDFVMSAAGIFGFEAGASASLSKLPIGGGVFAAEGKFGSERDFTPAKGFNVQFEATSTTSGKWSLIELQVSSEMTHAVTLRVVHAHGMNVQFMEILLRPGTMHI